MEQFCGRKRVASDEVRALRPSPTSEAEPARHGRGGFVCGVAVALEAARAPSARGAQRGGGQGGAGAAAPERSAPRLRSPLAPGPAAYLERHPLCVACRAEGRLEPATVVDHVVPHRGDLVLFWDERNWAALARLATIARRRARAAGAEAPTASARGVGGPNLCHATGQGPAPGALCVAAKFGRGVSGRYAAESPGFLPTAAPRFLTHL